ncbi:hypothetical protein B0I35DRAFT_234739 [Stachybotrys elegans]|uniref:Uncharacterized protein n=1 Tax=Stachybotrys elegans TaxID=80388 RepID=A0A8K0SNB5_9HYPO|nr:hypothetical protein B0I35DRAFT_234739 [Stachybotrys elegans]
MQSAKEQIPINIIMALKPAQGSAEHVSSLLSIWQSCQHHQLGESTVSTTSHYPRRTAKARKCLHLRFPESH